MGVLIEQTKHWHVTRLCVSSRRSTTRKFVDISSNNVCGMLSQHPIMSVECFHPLQKQFQQTHHHSCSSNLAGGRETSQDPPTSPGKVGHHSTTCVNIERLVGRYFIAHQQQRSKLQHAHVSSAAQKWPNQGRKWEDKHSLIHSFIMISIFHPFKATTQKHSRLQYD